MANRLFSTVLENTAVTQI